MLRSLGLFGRPGKRTEEFLAQWKPHGAVLKAGCLEGGASL